MQRSTMPRRIMGLVGMASIMGCGDPDQAAAPVDTQATITVAVQATVGAMAPSATRPPVAAPTATPLDNEVIQQALSASGLPVGEVRVFTAETDPNNLLGRPLLGRPNQYTAKVSRKDARAPFDDATLEVFPDDASLKACKDHTEAISKTGGPFAQ